MVYFGAQCQANSIECGDFISAVTDADLDCAVVHMNDVVAAEEVNATLQFVGESCNVSFADDGVDNPVPANPRYHPDRFPTLPPSADHGEI